jgi:hypothetical protein
MHMLNILSVTLWLVITYQALAVLIHLKDKGMSRREITTFTIFLLCGLNICRGLISLAVDIPPAYTGQRLLEYFYIGSSVFQLLLCNIVLKYIKNKS